MKQTLTNSVAIFFKPYPGTTISELWLDRALSIIEPFRLSPILFTAAGGRFALDDCYWLADDGNIRLFDENISGQRTELAAAIAARQITFLGIDVPCPGCRDRSEWRAALTENSERGALFIGLEADMCASVAQLLRQVLNTFPDIPLPTYGFGYQMPLSDDPECHASGIRAHSLDEVRQLWRDRHQVIARPKHPDELWRDEIYGRQRYLTGLFRAAYPVNLLSQAHVDAADLRQAHIGNLTQLGKDRWLWKLDDADLPAADALLEHKRLLVRQQGS